MFCAIRKTAAVLLKKKEERFTCQIRKKNERKPHFHIKTTESETERDRYGSLSPPLPHKLQVRHAVLGKLVFQLVIELQREKKERERERDREREKQTNTDRKSDI